MGEQETNFGTLDGRLAHVETAQEAHGARLGRLEGEVRDGFAAVMERLNRPSSIWPGVSVGAILVVAGVAGLNTYTRQEFEAAYREMDLRFSAAQGTIHGMQARMAQDDVREQKDAYNMGRIDEKIAMIRSQQIHADELYHKLDDRVQAQEANSAAARVSRQAIGDYSKETNSRLP